MKRSGEFGGRTPFEEKRIYPALPAPGRSRSRSSAVINF